VLAGGAAAQVLGDLDGDGAIDAGDVQWLFTVYPTGTASSLYDAGGDLNADGVIDYQDLAILASNVGQTPTAVPPATVFVTADEIPDDFNDLLALPPSGFSVEFAITNPPGAPLIDLSTLSVVADRPAGAKGAGSNLASLFGPTPSAGSWKVDPADAFPARNVFFTFQVQNLAGTLLSPAAYGVAVRDWQITPPIGASQAVFLDLDQDRDGIGGNDFDEDLREFGLGSLTSPSLSAVARGMVITRTLAQIRAYHGQGADGSPGGDSTTVAFSETSVPGATRICVGGEDPAGGTVFGFTPFDQNNAQTGTDTCFPSSPYGIFPREFLFFSGNSNFKAVFDPLRPPAGGVPVGEDPLDPIVLDPGFDPQTALPAELARWNTIDQAATTLARFTATITAHEAGHTLGLTPSGAAPGGLWGGSSGANQYHNLTLAGTEPPDNWIMNAGSAFTYEEIVGAAGQALPRFRELNDAYLRNELLLNGNITGLFDEPTLASVTPNPATYVGGQVDITLHGSGFFGAPQVLLKQDPFPARVVQNILVVDANTITRGLFQFQVGTGTFDVEVTNPDDQIVVLMDGLTVQ
jgi:hypothetical protein